MRRFVGPMRRERQRGPSQMSKDNRGLEFASLTRFIGPGVILYIL